LLAPAFSVSALSVSSRSVNRRQAKLCRKKAQRCGAGVTLWAASASSKVVRDAESRNRFNFSSICGFVEQMNLVGAGFSLLAAKFAAYASNATALQGIWNCNWSAGVDAWPVMLNLKASLSNSFAADQPQPNSSSAADKTADIRVIERPFWRSIHAKKL